MSNEAFNSILRGGARGQTVEPAPRDVIGSVGIGRGGAGYQSPARTRTTSRGISDAIRRAADRATRRVDAEGVDVTELLGGR